MPTSTRKKHWRPKYHETTGMDYVFAGRHNARAMIEVLVQRYGLDDKASARGSKVMLAGGSAGAFGALINAPMVARYLRRTANHGRLRVVSDAGNIVPFGKSKMIGTHFTSNPPGLPVHNKDALSTAYDFWDSHLYGACEQAQAPGHESDCFYTAVLAPYIEQDFRLPILFQQGSLDHTNALKQHNLNTPALKTAWQNTYLTETKALTWFFSGPGHYHTIMDDDTTTQGWNMHPPNRPQDSLMNLVLEFWGHADPRQAGHRIVWQ